jgi:hypothetical protein
MREAEPAGRDGTIHDYPVRTAMDGCRGRGGPGYFLFSEPWNGGAQMPGAIAISRRKHSNPPGGRSNGRGAFLPALRDAGLRLR